VKIKIYITSLILFFAIIACVVPGISQPDAIPTYDVNMIPTMVVLTANALASQTAAAITPLPIETSTPIPTPTETATATPRVSLSGTSLLVRDDQTTVFTDREAGIEFIIPAGWMPVRVNEQDYFDAFVSDAAKDPFITQRLVQIQTADVSRFRLEAFDVRPGHIVNEIITIIDFVFEAGDSRSLEDMSEEWRNKDSIYVNYKFTHSGYAQASNGIRILVIERRYGPSEKVVFHRGVFFKIPSGIIRFDFFTNMDFKDVVLPDFEMVINSVTLLSP
jgi:hypothetical protein